MDFFFSIIHKHTHTHTSSQFTFALSLAHIIIAHLSVTDHPATLTPHPFPIFGTALLIVHLPPISPYPLKLPSNHPLHPPHPTGHSLPAHTHSSRVQQEPGLYGNSVTKCQSSLWALCVEQSARHPHMLPSRYTASWLFSTAIVVQLPPSELCVCVCHMSFKWVALLCTAFLSPLFFSGQSLSSFSNFYSNSFMQVQRLHPKHTIPSLHLGLEPLKYTWLALHSFILLNLYF